MTPPPCACPRERLCGPLWVVGTGMDVALLGHRATSKSPSQQPAHTQAHKPPCITGVRLKRMATRAMDTAATRRAAFPPFHAQHHGGAQATRGERGRAPMAALRVCGSAPVPFLPPVPSPVCYATTPRSKAHGRPTPPHASHASSTSIHPPPQAGTRRRGPFWCPGCGAVQPSPASPHLPCASAHTPAPPVPCPCAPPSHRRASV